MTEAKKQGNQHLVVSVCHIVASNAERRFRRAIDILLKAARDTSQAEDSPDADKEKPTGTHQDASEGECKHGDEWEVRDI